MTDGRRPGIAGMTDEQRQMAVSFQRSVQVAINDVIHAVGLARVRRFYVELIPAMRPWFMEPTDEQRTSWSSSELASGVGRWQLALTVGSAIAVTNSVVGGAVCAITLDLFLSPSLGVTIIAGLIASTLLGALHFWYQVRASARTNSSLRQPNQWDPMDR